MLAKKTDRNHIKEFLFKGRTLYPYQIITIQGNKHRVEITKKGSCVENSEFKYTPLAH